MNIGAPRSSREWWYLIAIIMLCEGILLHFIYTKGYDENAQRAWEFGHVVVAIVLAVLAIIYGFLQGESQANAIARVQEALAMLGNVSRGLESSENTLRAELQRLSNVFPQLQDIKSSIASTTSAMSKMEANLDQKLAEQFVTLTKSKPGAEKLKLEAILDKPETLGTLFSNVSGFGAALLITLRSLDGKAVNVLAGVGRTITRATIEDESKSDTDLNWFLHGMHKGMVELLKELQLVSESGDSIRLRPSFKKMLDESFPTVDPEGKNVISRAVKYAQELPNVG